MLNDMKTAVDQHDATALVSHFAQNANITLVLPADAGGTMHLSPEQYREMVAQSWKAQSSSTYRVSNVVIKVSADGQTATASDTTTETLQVYGQTFSSVADERMKIVVVNGKLRITSLYAIAR